MYIIIQTNIHDIDFVASGDFFQDIGSFFSDIYGDMSYYALFGRIFICVSAIFNILFIIISSNNIILIYYS